MPGDPCRFVMPVSGALDGTLLGSVHLLLFSEACQGVVTGKKVGDPMPEGVRKLDP
ncbi:MAG: hypothetical protein KatS3mg105_0538 [Gemmatales bacterium]|nr:MAG: hypothetical protein KatS3mg105_0538 [Gemmatales bacterium]